MTEELRAPKSTVNKKFLLNTIVNVDSHNAHNIRERERAKQAARASDLVINHKASQQIRKDDEKEREMWLRRKQANMTDGQSKQRKRKRVHSADTDGFVDLSSYADDPFPSSTVGVKRKAKDSASEDKDEDDDDDDDKEDEEEVDVAENKAATKKEKEHRKDEKHDKKELKKKIKKFEQDKKEIKKKIKDLKRHLASLSDEKKGRKESKESKKERNKSEKKKAEKKKKKKSG
jgi:hypothetical protein